LVALALCQSSALAMGMPLADEITSIPTLHSRTAVFRWLHPVQPAPLASFRALDGTAVDLTQFQGKVVLVHFWATWCVLCIYELPALDRLAAHQSGDRFTVVAVSMDQDAPRTVPPFIARNHLVHLPVYLDPNQDFASAFPRYGIPMTYLIDSVGDIIGFVEGTVQWDTSEAQRFIDYFLAAP
jgi:thiol-disulfide isomerase/thioredoxin